MVKDPVWEEKMQEIKQFCSHNSQPTKEQINQLMKIYSKHYKVFSNKPGKIIGVQCKLPIRENVTFNKRSYPIPYKLREQVQEEIDKMLSEDIIEISQSEHTSPLVVIPKKDKSLRLCLDARQINQMIIADKTSPENIGEILKRFTNIKFFSSWDAVSGYWQV